LLVRLADSAGNDFASEPLPALAEKQVDVTRITKHLSVLLLFSGAALSAGALTWTLAVHAFSPTEANSASYTAQTRINPRIRPDIHGKPWSNLASGDIVERGSPVSVESAPERRDADLEMVELTAATNMRFGPSSSTRVIKVQPAGARLRVKSRDDNWVEVLELESSRTGWVYSKFLTPADPRSSQSAVAHPQ